MLNDGVSVSASPSAIAFASVRGSLGSPSVVAVFGHVMARHGIVVPRRRRRRLRGHSSTDAECKLPQKKREEKKEWGGANNAMEDKERSNGGEDGRRKELAYGVNELRWGGWGRARLTLCRSGQM